MNTYTLNQEESEYIVHIARNNSTPKLLHFYLAILKSPDFDMNTYSDCMEYLSNLGFTPNNILVSETLKQLALSPECKRELVPLIVKHLININTQPGLINDVFKNMPSDLREYVIDTIFFKLT